MPFKEKRREKTGRIAAVWRRSSRAGPESRYWWEEETVLIRNTESLNTLNHQVDFSSRYLTSFEWVLNTICF